MLCDFHIHTCLSADCDSDIDDVILCAIQKGMTHLCITDHHDIDYNSDEEGLSFLLNPSAYYHTLCHYREKYKRQIRLLIGVELGLQPHILPEASIFLSHAPFDFIIGSSHLINGIDPYYDTLWKDHTREEVMLMYFENILNNLTVFHDFDVYGHLDYAIRYAKNQDDGYSFDSYREILEAILEKIIAMDKGIEINTGGLRNGLRSTNPSAEIIREYKKLGGKIITIGSDAHKVADIGGDFSTAKQILHNCGFSEYYIFDQRTPIAIPIDL